MSSSYMREMLADTVRDSADPAYLVDSTGRITAWNSAAAGLFELPSWRAIGKPCAAVVRGCSPSGVAICSLDCTLRRQLTRGDRVPAIDMLVRVGGRPASRSAVRVHHLLFEDRVLGPLGILHLLSTPKREEPGGFRSAYPACQVRVQSSDVPGLYLG